MAKPYTLPNNVSGVLASTYVHGTETHLHLVAIGLFAAGGGFVRVYTTDKLHWADLEYTGVSTNDLTGLALCTGGNVESEAAYSFPAGSIVARVPVGQDVSELITGPATAMDGHFFVADGTSGKKAKDGGAPYTDVGFLNFNDVTELTIASGAITATQSFHTIDTQADAATDDLDTISGGTAGDILYLRLANAARIVVLKHNTGNIHTPYGADVTVDSINTVVCLAFNGTDWLVVGDALKRSATRIKLTTADQDTVKDDWRLILFNADVYDILNESVLANNAIVVQQAGIYLLSLEGQFNESLSAGKVYAFKIQGSTAGIIKASQAAAVGTELVGLACIAVAFLVAGESVTGYSYHNYTENRTIQAEYNILTVVRLH